MPLPIVAGNWKMHTTVDEARELATAMKPRLEATGEGVRKVICPPFVSLTAVREVLLGSSISLGAQNMHFEDRGAYTGEVSPLMLAELCQFVILGHSERRQALAEADEFINLKVRSALRVGLTPILCVGEGLREREEGCPGLVIETQLRGCLVGIDSAEDLMVAYEPVWAIGTGRAATPELAQSVMAHIREVLGSLYGDGVAANVALLYGGSVNARNTSDIMKQPDIDGALVGGASLDADSFVEIVREAAAKR